MPEAKLREAFGPVIDRLAANGIDLTKQNVEVAPIAHYHMGGVQADARMATEVPGLLVAGEAVGGANGANRLSGNAITEALVFGRQAGRTAAERVKEAVAAFHRGDAARDTLELLASAAARRTLRTPPRCSNRCNRPWPTTSARCAAKPRSSARLAVSTICRSAIGERPFGGGQAFDMVRLDWLDLRNMLTVARAVTQAALNRTESRGAHQREDFPGMLPEWNVNQMIRLDGGRLDITTSPASVVGGAAQ